MSIIYEKLFKNNFIDITENIFKYLSWRDKLSFDIATNNNSKTLLRQAQREKNYEMVLFIISVCDDLPKINYSFGKLKKIYRKLNSRQRLNNGDIDYIDDFLKICNKTKNTKLINEYFEDIRRCDKYRQLFKKSVLALDFIDNGEIYTFRRIKLLWGFWNKRDTWLWDLKIYEFRVIKKRNNTFTVYMEIGFND